MKKWFSMLLVVVMVVSVFAGCGKQEETKGTVSTNSSVSSETKQEETKVEEKEEPTVISLGATNALQMDPIPWYETEIWKAILKEANVELEFIQYDEETFNLMLSSGDLPDIVFSTFGAKIDDIVKGGLALDLAPYIEEYAPNMALDIYKQRNELVVYTKGGEDKALYFVAPRIGVENARGGVDSSRGYNIRWDYYKELNCTEFKNDDEYIDVLEQMVKAHPETETGEKTYAMGLYDDLSIWNTRAAFVKPVLGNIWTFSGSQYMSSYVDGHLINGYTETEESAYWTDMKFYNKLYNKGLLDPDSFTQTVEEYYDKVYAGRYMATPTKVNGFYNENVKADPETLAGMIRVPTEAHIVFGNKKLMTGNFPNNYLFVSKDTENVEAVMRFLNVMHDMDIQRMLASGIEGVHWNYVDGVPTYTDEVKNMIATKDPKLTEEIGITLYAGFEPLAASFEHSDGYPICLNDSDSVRAETDSYLMKDVAKHYGAEYGAKAVFKYVEEGKTIDASNDCGQLIASVMPVQPTDVSRTLEKLNDILYRAIPELVMAADDAAFGAVQARVIKDLEAAGAAEAWEWCSTEYYKAREEILPIFEAVTW